MTPTGQCHVMVQGLTPLHTAAMHSSFQSHLVAAELLAQGADAEAPDGCGRTPLLLALESNRKEAIDALLAAGARLYNNCCCQRPLRGRTKPAPFQAAGMH